MNKMIKILVLEDDTFLLSAYKLKFEKLGYEMKSATSGSEGLEILKSWRPEVIILDLIMPDMDGYSFLKEVKADPKYKDIIVMVASNLGQKEDVDKATGMGADAFVVKGDLSLTELASKLDNLIKEKDGR